VPDVARASTSAASVAISDSRSSSPLPGFMAEP
jgi:hypothetical protein